MKFNKLFKFMAEYFLPSFLSGVGFLNLDLHLFIFYTSRRFILSQLFRLCFLMNSVTYILASRIEHFF